MRFTFSFIFSIIFAVGLVAFGFTLFQSSTERKQLNSELAKRTRLVTENIFKDDTLFFEKINQNNVRHFADSINKEYNLLGFAIYYNYDSILTNKSVDNLVYYSKAYIYQSITADTCVGNYFKSEGRKIYQYIVPISKVWGSGKAVVFYSDAGYIDKVIGRIWFRNFMRWFIQAFFVSVVTLLLIRWGIFRQINKIVVWAKAVRTGNGDEKSLNLIWIFSILFIKRLSIWQKR